jgi:hypothetical protein
VAVGGIDCETVVLADCATASATRADAMERVESILTIAGSDERLKAAKVLMEELGARAGVNASCRMGYGLGMGGGERSGSGKK